ncbi:MAG TPA: hypothetical protein V6C65_26940 [Allocoleopsis sp.]
MTEGDTIEELQDNLKDAIEGWLEVAGNWKIEELEAQVLEITV